MKQDQVFEMLCLMQMACVKEENMSGSIWELSITNNFPGEFLFVKDIYQNQGDPFEKIVIMDVNLQAEISVISNDVFNYFDHLQWSADGLQVAFNGYKLDKSVGTYISDFTVIESGLFIINIDGTGLIKNSDESRSDFDWYTGK